MCSLSVVALLLFLFLKDDLCRLYLVLKVHSVSPTYFSVLFVSFSVTVAWYITFCFRHSFSNGHGFDDRQLQLFVFLVWVGSGWSVSFYCALL